MATYLTSFTFCTMATDEEKSKIVKLLEGLDVPEVKISKRCLGLVKEFHQKYSNELDTDTNLENESYDNPYIPDKVLLEENEKKLKALLEESTGQHILRPDTRQCFLRSLGELRQLRILALEYAHIADGTGNALLSLLPVIRRPHFRLQLICRENQIPGKADAMLGVGGYDIPDTAWRRVTTCCPDLYLFMAFFRIRDYDNVRRFLTPSVPLREAHLQLGVDLNVTQRQDSDLSCFMRSIAYYYSDSLVTLSVHQWRSAELPLRRVLELMPRLTRLLYIGRCCEQDLRKALTIVSCGVCEKLKQIDIQIQDEDSKRTYWSQTVEVLTEQYKDIMQLFDIKFSLEIYKC